MKIIRYWEVSEEELTEFYSSLSSEKETFRTPLRALLNSEILLAERVEGEIAGICGLIKSRLLPRMYLVVKEKYQGRGIGKKLHERLEERVENHYTSVKVIVGKRNTRALRIFKKKSYDVAREDEEFYYLIRLTKFRIFQPIVVLLFKLASKANLLRYRLTCKGKL